MADKKNDNVLNLFKNAREIALPPVNGSGKGGDGKDQKVEVELGEDLTTLATAKMLAKSLENLAAKYDIKIKARMAEEFANMATRTGKRPMNFKGVSQRAEASCELRKRASSSPLSPEEIKLLEAADIPLGVDTLHEAVPERFFFNPEIVANASLAAKISAALAHIPELTGQEIVLRQPARPAETRTYVPEEALDAVASIKDVQLIKELLPIVSNLAIRVKLVSTDLNDALGIFRAGEVNL